MQKADAKAGRETSCDFCRTPPPKFGPGGNEERIALVRKRVEARDAFAIRMLGQYHFNGENGLPRNAVKGTELKKEAANLGNVV